MATMPEETMLMMMDGLTLAEEPEILRDRPNNFCHEDLDPLFEFQHVRTAKTKHVNLENLVCKRKHEYLVSKFEEQQNLVLKPKVEKIECYECLKHNQIKNITKCHNNSSKYAIFVDILIWLLIIVLFVITNLNSHKVDLNNSLALNKTLNTEFRSQLEKVQALLSTKSSRVLMLVPETRSNSRITQCFMANLALIFSESPVKIWTPAEVNDVLSLKRAFRHALSQDSAIFALHGVDQIDQDMAKSLYEIIYRAEVHQKKFSLILSLSSTTSFGGHPSIVASNILETKWDALGRRDLKIFTDFITANAIRLNNREMSEMC